VIENLAKSSSFLEFLKKILFAKILPIKYLKKGAYTMGVLIIGT
jgi:hypothetical protein